MALFPTSIQKIAAWLPFQHIAFTPLQIYLGKLSGLGAARALLTQWVWVAALLWLGHLWWNRATRKITIHGG
jgi:ABC-2 type transport system permease protein